MNHSQVSPGLWALAWRRLRADKLAMGAMAVVLAFLVLIALSAAGLLAADWEQESGVSYAPPTFLGSATPAATAAPAAAPAAVDNPLDPLRDVLHTLRGQLAAPASTGIDDYGIADPLAADLAAIQAKFR